ncbi:hypothetical protein HOLleu_42701 [Holothuria leucospilota]|uniref:Uncharacterized protein n=1 Tax=Holothuria leucospilota TaxID=206669 RepID=A0A9Q0YAA1_HOLLE|nr:hypothetical protein HOLleu_42701 [Holothuria leucospilota]
MEALMVQVVLHCVYKFYECVNYYHMMEQLGYMMTTCTKAGFTFPEVISADIFTLQAWSVLKSGTLGEDLLPPKLVRGHVTAGKLNARLTMAQPVNLDGEGLSAEHGKHKESVTQNCKEDFLRKNVRFGRTIQLKRGLSHTRHYR